MYTGMDIQCIKDCIYNVEVRDIQCIEDWKKSVYREKYTVYRGLDKECIQGWIYNVYRDG